MTRKEIDVIISDNKKKIQAILDENRELSRQKCLICDEDGFFTEEIEHHPRRPYQRGRNALDGKLVGRNHWFENFKDEDTGELVTIERTEIVRIDGVWTF
jgi:hypothetical protein